MGSEKEERTIAPVIAHLVAAVVNYYIYEGKEDKAVEIVRILKELAEAFEEEDAQ